MTKHQPENPDAAGIEKLEHRNGRRSRVDILARKTIALRAVARRYVGLRYDSHIIGARYGKDLFGLTFGK